MAKKAILINGAKKGVDLWVFVYGCKLKAQKRVLINGQFLAIN
jgi:hypothetical protein